MSEQEWLTKDFYATLGVKKDADGATIKKAYRKLARQWHPDQNKGDAQAEAKFKDIGEAYSVLSNTEQRKRYDALRAMAGGGPRFSAGSSGGFEDVFGGFGGGNIRFSSGGNTFGAGGFEDILSGLFAQQGYSGGASGGAQSGFAGTSFAGASSPRPRQGNKRTASMTISFREALEGAMLKLKVSAESTTIKVPAGVKDGQKIRLRGKGYPGEAGGPPGDLEVTIHVKKHPVYTREGDNLRIRVPVTFAEAALGANIKVPLIDGTSVTVKVAPGTSSGTVLRVRGRGVTQKHGGSGDLLVDVQIVAPRDLSDEQKAVIESLRESLNESDPRQNLVAQAKE